MRSLAVALLAIVVGCGGSSDDGATSDSGSTHDGAIDSFIEDDTHVDDASSDARETATDGIADVVADAGPPIDTLADNRDRLLHTYYDRLKSDPSKTQSNGLSGAGVSSVCDLWSKLDPSDRAVFLTITARLQGSKLGTDNTSMLVHVTKLYRIAGGQGSTASDPGSCGGGEYNRMIMSQDATLHDTQVVANTSSGGKTPSGAYDIADVDPGGYWRNSHDVGGPHSPFDLSDETNDGAPRGQTQYFKDPTSTLAKTALGRLDVETVIDPYALEMDEDYDCVHNSNPSCSYVTYGPLCLPEANKLGTELFTDNYGDFDAAWKPAGCP
jgi:hypothetical protein